MAPHIALSLGERMIYAAVYAASYTGQLDKNCIIPDIVDFAALTAAKSIRYFREQASRKDDIELMDVFFYDIMNNPDILLENEDESCSDF